MIVRSFRNSKARSIISVFEQATDLDLQASEISAFEKSIVAGAYFPDLIS
jgi:hypothetical protein